MGGGDLELDGGKKLCMELGVLISLVLGGSW